MRPDNHMYRSALDSRKSVSRNRFASMAAVFAAFAPAALAACGDSATGPGHERGEERHGALRVVPAPALDLIYDRRDGGRIALRYFSGLEPPAASA